MAKSVKLDAKTFDLETAFLLGHTNQVLGFYLKQVLDLSARFAENMMMRRDVSVIALGVTLCTEFSNLPFGAELIKISVNGPEADPRNSIAHFEKYFVC